MHANKETHFLQSRVDCTGRREEKHSFVYSVHGNKATMYYSPAKIKSRLQGQDREIIIFAYFNPNILTICKQSNFVHVILTN